MKIGDQKQAIALGVVAFLAIGVLGKTALGALSKGNSNQPVVVKDVGGSAGAVIEPSKPDTVPITTTPLESSNSPTPPVSMTSIKRDAFEKPSVPEKTKSFNQYSKPPNRGEGESMVKTGTTTPWDPRNETIGSRNGDSGNGESGPKTLPNAGADNGNSNNDGPKKDLPKQVDTTTRYDGFVDAGSPMGIVSVQGKSFSVAVGDFVGFGYRVESISSLRMKIRKGKVVKTILIGKETRI